MPNWCDTTYKCVGEKKEIQALKKGLDANAKRKTSRVANGFGTLWLGNIIDQLGGDWEKYRCRGEITDYQMDGDDLAIYQCTAWCEQEGFRQFIEEKFPNIKVYWQDQEPGCDVYFTNSFDYFPERYFLDSYDEPLYFESLEELQRYVESLVGHPVEATFEALDSAISLYQEEQEEKGIDCFWSLHEFRLSED